MATHIPYHRWILISKSIWSLSTKLRRRNQLTSDRNLYSQIPVIPRRALQMPRAKNQPQSLLWLGWGDGIRISPNAPSLKLAQRCPHRYTRVWGTLGATCARDKKSPLPADGLSQHPSLASCFLLPPCKIEACIGTKPCCRKEEGWEAVSRTFFLNLFCRWETAAKRMGEEN